MKQQTTFTKLKKPIPFVNTGRLIIKPLTRRDKNFIFKLLNTEGWIRFIGNRNIISQKDASNYIQKILANQNVRYWVVENKTGQSLGIITYIKREYLPHHDIGFAFLPEFAGNGYAYEATKAVLNELINEDNMTYVFATTIPDNVNSIKLLGKLGLILEKEIEVDGEKLLLYGSSADTLDV